VETNGCGGYQQVTLLLYLPIEVVLELRVRPLEYIQVDGYRGFVFDGKTPCLIQSLSFKEGGKR